MARADHLARAVAQLHESELTAGLCATVFAVQLGVAVVLAPTADTLPFAARHLIPVLPLAAPLVALGLRRAPRGRRAGAGHGRDLGPRSTSTRDRATARSAPPPTNLEPPHEHTLGLSA